MSNKPVIFHDASVRANEVVANQKLAIGTSGETSELHIKAAAPEFRMEDKVGAAASETAFKIYADGGKTYIQSGVNFEAGSASNIIFGNMGSTESDCFLNIGSHGIETSGNIAVNNIQFQQLQGLEQITNISNTTSNTLNTTNTTAATSSGTGAITCAGGVGVAGNVYSGGLVLTTSTEPSVSPTTGAIQVAGGVGVQGNVYVGSQLDVSGNVQVGTANLFVDTTTGYVGVGTTSPDLELHVHDANAANSGIILSSTAGYHRLYDNGELYIQSGTAASADSRANIHFTSMYSSTSYMKILGSNGNVGIGMTNPSTTLDVNGGLRTRLPWFYARNTTYDSSSGTNYDVTWDTLVDSDTTAGTMYSETYACLFPIKGIYVVDVRVHSVFGSHEAWYYGSVKNSSGTQQYDIWSSRNNSASVGGNNDLHTEATWVIYANAGDYLDLQHRVSGSQYRNYNGTWNRIRAACIYEIN